MMTSDQSLRWRWLIAFREVNLYGKNLSSARMGILFSAATRANPEGAGIYRGIRGLAKDTGSDTKTVGAALERGRELNLIGRVASGRWREDKADVYRLIDPELWRLDFDANTEELPY